MTSNSNRVWDELFFVYDYYRDVRLSELYYGQRLKTCRLWSNFAQLGTVAFALGSGHLLIARNDLGPLPFTLAYVLTVIGVVLCEIIRTRGGEIKYAKLHFVYRTLFLDMRELVHQIRLKEGVGNTIRELIAASKRRERDVSSDEDEVPKIGSRRRFRKEVENEIPTDSLWMPQVYWDEYLKERSKSDES